MPILSPEQERRAKEVLEEYLAAPKNADGQTPEERQAERDKKREQLIENDLRPLLDGYLHGRVPLDEFKSKVDGINKRHTYWGFKGIKGQMFFNMLTNAADDVAECDQELNAALAVPSTEEIARSRIKTFASYVRRVGEQHLDAGGTKHGRPKPGSIPFFVSYFWQIHDRTAWPVYYTNGVNTMADLNLWQPGDDLAENYIKFKHIHEELAKLFSAETGRTFGLYDVEHVFWFKGGNPYGGDKPEPKPEPPKPGKGGTVVLDDEERLTHLPESHVPPIVAILPRMAQNEPGLAEVAKASGTSLARAFEKNVNAAFTILGYETKLLGQGQGRVPDGLAFFSNARARLVPDAFATSESHVPPIVAILPRMAQNEPGLAEVAKASGTSLARAFEKNVNAAFTILGYETKLLGQGQGRVPDGLALDLDDSYGIIWDAKVRSSDYSMGTDDRVIREYITTQSRELKKRRHLRNIYYAVVSSDFVDDYDDAIRSIKMDTDTNEVCLVRADALVAMVDVKLRDPQQITLGPDGLQRLFSGGGVLTSDDVLNTLT